MSSSLLIPLAFWNNLNNPTFSITLAKYPHVFAGLQNGHIWMYSATHTADRLELKHKLLLVGHKSAVMALCLAQQETEMGSEDILISASEDGEIIRWNVADGRCLSTNPHGFFGVPKSLKVFSVDQISRNSTQDKFIFCSGFSNEICILDATSLEIVRIWSGHSNWVTCTPFYDSVLGRRRLLTVTFDGALDLWDFNPHDLVVTRDYTPLEPLNVADEVLDLKSSNFDGELVMALTRTCALVFTIKESRFVPQLKIPCPAEISWAGSMFTSVSRLVLWSQTGEIHDYLIRAPQGIRRGSMVEHEDQLYYRVMSLKTYMWPEQRDHHRHHIHTAVFPSAADPSVQLVIGFRNRPAGSTFMADVLLSLADAPQLRTSGEAGESEVLPEEIELASLWPIKCSANKPVRTQTISTIAYDTQLAIGYSTGEITITPISAALIDRPDDDPSSPSADGDNAEACKSLHGHQGPVTCLFAPDARVFGKKYLLSGGEDCSVRIWNLNDGKLLATFTTHAQPVVSFLEPPEDVVGPRLRGCVVSVARDNSACVVSLEEMNCLYIFPGHSYPLCQIQWRPAEDYLIMAYSDGTAFVWQIQTAHVDRVVSGRTAAEVMDDSRWKVSRVKGDDYKTNSFRQTVTSFPVYSGADDTPALQIFMINIKHLVNDVYHSTLSSIRPSVDISEPAGEEVIGTPTPTTSTEPSTSTSFTILKASQGAPRDQEKRADTSVVSTVVAALMSWGIDQAIDQTCERSLGLGRPAANLTFGVRGANGNFSLIAPSVDPREFWTVSPVVSASRLLAVVSLVRSLLSVKGLEAQSTELITHYTSILPEIIGERFAYPSFSLLSKYWQDTSIDVQQSARTLFSNALLCMRPEVRSATVKYWLAFLPVNTTHEIGTQLMTRSTFILGIMGSDHSEVLSPAITKAVALSLTLLLNDDSKASSRIAAMELLARGFATWEPYLKTSELLRTLFAYATSEPAEFPVSGSSSGLLSSSNTNSGGTTSAQVTRQARNSIFQIATANTPLFVSTMTFDLMNAKKPADRTAILRVISLVVRKKPALLYSSVPRVAEAVVRTLDPNVPNMREVALQTATAMLHDLVKTYPSIDFHGPSQKLAVGTLEGAVIVYDLRTATRWVVLEGHTGPVTALSFSPDGRAVVSCSVQDSTVRMWRPNPGIFGILASSLSAGVPPGAAASGTDKGGRGALSASQKAYRTYPFGIDGGGERQSELPVTIILRDVKFEWPGDKSVRLRVKDMVMTFNV